MQYSQEHLKTMVYAKFGGQTECIMGNWKIENCIITRPKAIEHFHSRRQQPYKCMEEKECSYMRREINHHNIFFGKRHVLRHQHSGRNVTLKGSIF